MTAETRFSQRTVTPVQVIMTRIMTLIVSNFIFLFSLQVRSGDRQGYSRLTRALVAHRRGDTDTESEQDVYNRNYAPSAESLNPGFRSGVSDISNPTADYGAAGIREPYPAWTSERQIPLSKECVSFASVQVVIPPFLTHILQFIINLTGKSKISFSI